MNATASSPPEPQPRRLTHSQIIEQQIHALARGAGDHSTVRLARNARGDTQIEVSVRTGETADVATPQQAMELARSMYDELAALYPMVERDA